MTPQQFVEKWQRTELKERAASQEHFIDLCRMLGQPTPAEHDSTGAEYAFEKGTAVEGAASLGSKGDRGYADVWWHNKFAWEYKRKGKYKDLTDAYRQLQMYREALGNPPLLVVSDIARTEIHTNFTGTIKQVHAIALADLAKPESISLLRRVFTDPESFRPQVTVEKVTQDAAAAIGKLALNLQNRGHAPLDVAHFLMKCVFCLFAEDINLLPNKLFNKLLDLAHPDPPFFKPLATELFAAMKTGGRFGLEAIPFFNGGLFDDAAALDLDRSDLGVLKMAAAQDWSAVEPHIFGTLFERALDPSKRAQIGAHYTSREDIMLVVEPVILAPLRREWDAVKAKVAEQVERRTAANKATGTNKEVARFRADATRANNAIAKLVRDFQERLSHVRVLDPACGSGNFLYVSLQQLLNLEKEVIAFAAQPHIAAPLLPSVRPTQLYGIEINPYAAELASVVIWIGYLQWMRDNGFVAPSNPVLERMKNIENRDAILDLSDPDHPARVKWPEVDFIVGNPPFLGSKVFRKAGLSDAYLDALWAAHDVPRPSDLCCYWFDLARRVMEQRPGIRAGLLATQGIRGGENRTVLERIDRAGTIFNAWSDREWVLDGAAVNVSIVAFGGRDAAQHGQITLDGVAVQKINSDLTSGAATGEAKRLVENAGIAFMGDTKGGSFDVSLETALTLLREPNPTGLSNAEVVRPWINGLDITRRPRSMFIIDFGCEVPLEKAAGYAAPFLHVEKAVKPERVNNRRESYAKLWWLHVEPRPDWRRRAAHLSRFLGTARVAKHRLFIWVSPATLPDSQVIAFCRTDDYLFGMLQSVIHETWSLQMGTQLEDRPRYTPSTTFETFPLPWPPGKEDVKHPAYVRIAAAAKALNEQRERWLNPPEWIEPIADRIDREDTFADVPAEARALVRQSAIMAAAAKDAKLKKRTLTNLYNERPTWLELAHEQLDRAVLAAYAAIDPAGGWSEDWAAVWLDTGAGQPLPPDHPLAAKRAEVDQAVLANLLRLNHERAPAGGTTKAKPAKDEADDADADEAPPAKPKRARANQKRAKKTARTGE